MSGNRLFHELIQDFSPERLQRNQQTKTAQPALVLITQKNDRRQITDHKFIFVSEGGEPGNAGRELLDTPVETLESEGFRRALPETSDQRDHRQFTEQAAETRIPHIYWMINREWRYQNTKFMLHPHPFSKENVDRYQDTQFSKKEFQQGTHRAK